MKQKNRGGYRPTVLLASTKKPRDPGRGPRFVFLLFLRYINAGGHTSLLELRHHQFLGSIIRFGLLFNSIGAIYSPARKQCQEKNHGFRPSLSEKLRWTESRWYSHWPFFPDLFTPVGMRGVSQYSDTDYLRYPSDYSAFPRPETLSR